MLSVLFEPVVSYGLGAYGEDGVQRIISLLKDELEMCMRLMGTPTIADINESHVLTHNVSTHVNSNSLRSNMSMSNYQPMMPVSMPSKL